MPPPCKRCVATRLINLDTAQRIGVVGGGLVGGAIGALRATAATQTSPGTAVGAFLAPPLTFGATARLRF